MIVHITLSAMIACVIDIILIMNISLINQFIQNLGYKGNLFRPTEQTMIGQILIYLVIGILIFTLCFALMQRPQIKYMQKISSAMQDISNGDLTRSVEVEGDDELASIALEMNKMAQQVRTLMEREREAEQTKNELITNVAHDLRTPLTSVIGYLKLLSGGPELPPEIRRHYISIAYQKASHLQDLIEDLFGFTKLNYGTMTAEMGELDIVKLLGQLLDEFYPAFNRYHLKYQYHSNVPSQKIIADGTLLARLFDNLINNAIKYGYEGKIIRVLLEAKDTQVIIQVINYGNIIPKEELDAIFKKFYRMEQSRSSSTGGTGLGLAIAKDITELHNGSITVRSSLDGTVFEVILPVQPSDQPKPFQA